MTRDTAAYASVTVFHGESYSLWYVVSEEQETIASYRTKPEADAFASGYNTRITHEEAR